MAGAEPATTAHLREFSQAEFNDFFFCFNDLVKILIHLGAPSTELQSVAN